MRKIEQIEVKLVPWHYTHTDAVMLRLTVRCMGREYHHEEALLSDDLESDFDRMFDRAKRALLATLRKQPIDR